MKKSSISKGKSMEVNGVINKEQFYNKAGKPIDGSFDYFMNYDGNKKFIKFMESSVTVQDIEHLLEKKTVYIIEEKEGLWDTDDPIIQSRIGEYIIILKIII